MHWGQLVFTERREKKTSRALNVNKDAKGKRERSFSFLFRVTCEALVLGIDGGEEANLIQEAPVRFENLPLETVVLFSVFALCFYSMWMNKSKSLNGLCRNRNAKQLLPPCIEALSFFHSAIQPTLAPVQKVLKVYFGPFNTIEIHQCPLDKNNWHFYNECSVFSVIIDCIWGEIGRKRMLMY